MLKIQIADGPDEVRLSLAGRISAEHLGELRHLLADALESGRPVRLDLGQVTLAERSVVRFLALGLGETACIEPCPAFLREWILREAEHSRGGAGLE